MMVTLNSQSSSDFPPENNPVCPKFKVSSTKEFFQINS